MLKPCYALIDCTTGQINDYLISPKNYELSLAGKALSVRILCDELVPVIDPLSHQNISIINTGSLNGTGASSSNRFNMDTPSNCEAQFRKAGYEGRIFKGRAEKPSYIEILDGDIKIKDTTYIWERDTEQIQHQFDQHCSPLITDSIITKAKTGLAGSISKRHGSRFIS